MDDLNDTIKCIDKYEGLYWTLKNKKDMVQYQDYQNSYANLIKSLQYLENEELINNLERKINLIDCKLMPILYYLMKRGFNFS